MEEVGSETCIPGGRVCCTSYDFCSSSRGLPININSKAVSYYYSKAMVSGVRAMYVPVAPVAYQVILEPGTGQFREFEAPRVHTILV